MVLYTHTTLPAIHKFRRIMYKQLSAFLLYNVLNISEYVYIIIMIVCTYDQNVN